MPERPSLLARLMVIDAQLSSSMRMQPSRHWLWKAAALFAHSGDSWFWLAGLGILWLVSDPTWKRNIFIAGAAIVVLAVFVLAIKFIIRRERPEGEWGQIYRSADPHSFPSGHAARAALIVMLGFTLLPAWVGAILTVWGILVCLARVATGVHYLSDVIAGLVLGVLAGVGIYCLFFIIRPPLLL